MLKNSCWVKHFLLRETFCYAPEKTHLNAPVIELAEIFVVFGKEPHRQMTISDTNSVLKETAKKLSTQKILLLVNDVVLEHFPPFWFLFIQISNRKETSRECDWSLKDCETQPSTKMSHFQREVETISFSLIPSLMKESSDAC